MCDQCNCCWWSVGRRKPWQGLQRSGAVAILSANGSAPFQRKLRSHWLKLLRQRHVAVVIQGPGHQLPWYWYNFPGIFRCQCSRVKLPYLRCKSIHQTRSHSPMSRHRFGLVGNTWVQITRPHTRDHLQEERHHFEGLVQNCSISSQHFVCGKAISFYHILGNKKNSCVIQTECSALRYDYFEPFDDISSFLVWVVNFRTSIIK